MKVWNNDEVIELFSQVEDCKKRGESIKNAFMLHAKKYGRKTNSVRNYYYLEVDNLKSDLSRQEMLHINLQMHRKNHFIGFAKSDCERLVEDIEKLRKQGYSVRSACHKLAGGNLTEMTRLQNKYQNIKKKSIKNAKNIVIFQKKENIVSEKDLNGLIMGLVKLIKKTAVENFIEEERLLGDEKKQSVTHMKREIAKKNLEVEEIKKRLEIAKKENLNLRKLLNDLSKNNDE